MCTPPAPGARADTASVNDDSPVLISAPTTVAPQRLAQMRARVHASATAVPTDPQTRLAYYEQRSLAVEADMESKLAEAERAAELGL